MKVFAIMPCYKTASTAPSIAKSLLDYVDMVICVDDGCPQNSGHEIQSFINSPRIKVLFHTQNRGVGAATKTGIRMALDLGAEIVVKVDSDGQMNISLIPKLIRPIIEARSDLCKGNRFNNINSILSMPFMRLIGNTALGFITKLSTGYWELFDPTNGFIAMPSETVKNIQIDKTHNRFFFETDLLFRCGLYDLIVTEVPMNSIYRSEKSNLNPFYEFFIYLFNNILIFIKRLFYQYFVLDFNPGSLSLVLGLFIGSISLVIGIGNTLLVGQGWLENPSTIKIIFLITTIISVQLLFSFIYYDAIQRPMLRRLKKSLNKN